jgi:hypothetical protein
MYGAELPADRAMAAEIAFGYLHPADLLRNNVHRERLRGDEQQVRGMAARALPAHPAGRYRVSDASTNGRLRLSYEFLKGPDRNFSRGLLLLVKQARERLVDF